MISVSNIKFHEGVDFNDYLSMPGFSYSRLKASQFVGAPTEKMRFGSLVDAYLFEPEKYNGEQIDVVRPVAIALKEKLGILLYRGKRQLAVTADFHYDGMVLKFKGRIDLLVPGLVVDLKVSRLELVTGINHFGYHHQMSGYCLGSNTDRALIISGHPDTKRVTCMNVGKVEDFWRDKILQHGQPI